SINDVSELYEDYYGSYLSDNSLTSDRNLLISAGIIAFLEAIHLDHIDSLLPFLASNDMERDGFIEGVRKLHDMEIVDICHDKAVRFSEQCLSNFLLKYVYYDKRLIKLSEIVKACFLTQRERTVSSINTLLSVFRKKELHEFVAKEIKMLWDQLAVEQPDVFFEYLKIFFGINPTESLLVLQREVEESKTMSIEFSDIDTSKGKNYKNVSDDIITILSGFADMEELSAAMELFLLYFLKRPDLYIEFYHAINTSYGIRKDSQAHGCFTQITLFEKLIAFSDNWQTESVTTLFLEVAEEFLGLCFSPSEGGRKHSITIYTIPLELSDGVKRYRALIWDSLLVLSKLSKYKEAVKKILSSYGKHIGDASHSVMRFDLQYIESVMKTSYKSDILGNCLLAEKIVQTFEYANLSIENLFAEYFSSEEYSVYQILKGPSLFKKCFEYEEYECKRKQTIEEYVSSGDKNVLFGIIDICKKLDDLGGRLEWEIGQGLKIALDTILIMKKCYVDVIEYYLRKNTPCNINPIILVGGLFSVLDNAGIYKLINSYEYKAKNNWIFAYYHELPQEYIDELALENLYTFLSDSSDKDISSSPYRGIEFLEKYKTVDENVFITGCQILLSKMEYSPFIVDIYFSLSFNPHHIPPQTFIQKFNDCYVLLEDIYITLLKCNTHHDYDGKLLREIYIASPSILEKYINYLIEKGKNSLLDDGERAKFFFELDDYIKVFCQIFDVLIKEVPFPTISLPHYLEAILLPHNKESDLFTKQDLIIKFLIQNFSNEITKMKCLFEIISKLPQERKLDYWRLFIKYNEVFDDFRNLSLTPMSWNWSGSAVPMYSAWIDFLELLLPHFTGLKWIQHRKHIDDHIERLKRFIEKEQIDEILQG
ncbi:MAG: ATP-binding protein, partial [Lachnoclostridium sp.]|nr:ATP-binding protein [Lachnoclostridium sp.]